MQLFFALGCETRCWMPLWAVHRPTAFPDTLDASLSSHTALAPYFPLLDSQSVIKIQKFRLLVDAQRRSS